MIRRLYGLLLLTLVGCFIITCSLAGNASQKYDQPDTQVNCEKNPLYCGILKLRPQVDRQWAMRFSNLLHKYGQKYDMDPWQSLAIAMQESSLRPIHRWENVIIQKCDQPSKLNSDKDKANQGRQCQLKYIKAITDMSVFQFHVQTILDFDLDYRKLQKSLEYAVKCHFELLKTKIKNCPSKPGLPAWTCYHSYHVAYRRRYYNKVKRYYIKPTDSQSSTKGGTGKQQSKSAADKTSGAS